jgi:hypothetical protein
MQQVEAAGGDLAGLLKRDLLIVYYTILGKIS